MIKSNSAFMLNLFTKFKNLNLMRLTLQKANLQKNTPQMLLQKYLRDDLNIKSKLVRLPMMICLCFFTLFSTQDVQAQVYAGSFSFVDVNDASNTVTFDYELVCSADGTSADLTVTFTGGNQPPGFVAAIQIPGPSFPNLNGSYPNYTYTLAGLTDCEFDFRFRFPYAGGLYESPFLTPANAPLPVTLTNFSATTEDSRTAKLAWKTASEINSDYFGIERSMDGRNWETLDKVKAAGFSNTDISYSFVDTDLSLNTNSEAIFYYRLKMTDLDDTYEYSDIRGVQFEQKNIGIISVYPNPTIDRLNVDLSDIDFEVGSIQLGIYNDAGSELISKRVAGNGIEFLDMTSLPSATYHIILRQGTEIIHQSTLIKID